MADTGTTLHARWGDARVNDVPPANADTPPVLIEVMEFNLDSALRRVRDVARVNNDPTRSSPYLALAIAYNTRAREQHYDPGEGRLRQNWTVAGAYGQLAADCQAIAAEMERLGVLGSCFPVVWSPTDTTVGGYTFPFLEMRARTTLHAGTQEVVKLLTPYGEPIVRSMDADVSQDPLLRGQVTPGELEEISAAEGGSHVMSGGYKWDDAPRDQAFWGASNAAQLARWNRKWSAVIGLVNRAEHEWRDVLVHTAPSLVYLPEPNTYMTATARRSGATKALESARPGVQMRESIFYLKKLVKDEKLTASYEPSLTTTKPVKTYFNWLRDLIKTADTRLIDPGEIAQQVAQIRQTHLSPAHIGDIQKREWYDVPHPVQGAAAAELERGRAARVDTLSAEIHIVLHPEGWKAPDD